MLSTALFISALGANSAAASAVFRRTGCHYTPGQKNGNDWTTTSEFLLRVEDASNNKTLGYVDGMSTNYAIVSSRDAASSGFIAPYYNNYGSLIFWGGGNATDHALFADDTLLPNSSSILPITTSITVHPSGQVDCGTAPVYISPKYTSTGNCSFGADDVVVHFRCPRPGTTNDTPNPCYAQSYFGKSPCVV
jgi:hypothetical protein